MKVNIINFLKKRNLYHQITNNLSLIQNIPKKIFFYCGFDLTSDSLHIGHLSILFFCKRLYDIGYNLLILLGGATSNIVDISDKKKLNLNNNIKININKNKIKIKKQIIFFLKKLNIKKYKILNNFNWLNSIKLIKFLKNIGAYISIKNIINKEIIKNNIYINFKNFSYILLQSYDFYYLYKKYNVILQIGGSDQWGNIISGINLINKKCNFKPFGITLPLLTNKNGTKFSKSNKLIKNIWLDLKKTSLYNFYQFLINISDKQICFYLKIFTFININLIIKIEKIIKIRGISYFNGKLQKLLANNLIKLIYGKNNLNNIKLINKLLFNNLIDNFKKKHFLLFKKLGINTIYLNNNNNNNKSIILKELINIIIKSKKKSINFIKNKSILLNGNLKIDPEYILTNKDKLYNKYILIKKGKKDFFLIIC